MDGKCVWVWCYLLKNYTRYGGDNSGRQGLRADREARGRNAVHQVGQGHRAGRGNHPLMQIKITNIDQQTFEFILQILVTLNYELKEPPKIKTNVIEDVIGKELAALIAKLLPKELNTLYRAVHFLKIYPLRRAIAAVVATRVYIQPTLEDYNNKKTELKLEKELNTDISKEYKERFPFMN